MVREQTPLIFTSGGSLLVLTSVPARSEMAVGDNKCENSCRATGPTNPDQSSTNSLNVKFEGRFLSQVTQRKCIIEIFVGDQI